MKQVNVKYFAWVRERIGKSSERVETNAETVRQLVVELGEREPRYELAFSDLASLRVAVNHVLADFDSRLENGAEIAFFPPMTGG
ncbi:MAG: molybdopterin converting factor subunit 1 [Rhodobacteraceae bacterium]|nr:molybdopterin converting factor subunit 1 [Paracoccaceae bacterium]